MLVSLGAVLSGKRNRLGRLEDLAPAGAAWAHGRGKAARALGADVWAEAFCGPPDTGAWVHADPLLGWLDTCARSASPDMRGTCLQACSTCITVCTPVLQPNRFATFCDGMLQPLGGCPRRGPGVWPAVLLTRPHSGCRPCEGRIGWRARWRALPRLPTALRSSAAASRM